MVLAAVDDLMFSSKIRATAKQVGAEVVFARSPDEILTQARALKPSLVVFDLNSQKTRPLETIARFKADADLAATRIVGFVSHVHTEVIESARAAGADEILARSAFAANLDQILRRG